MNWHRYSCTTIFTYYVQSTTTSCISVVLCSRYSYACVYRIVSEANEPIQGLHV
ncbi:uncharacterized protein EURHEDRAFT_246545 [Aspergillus ruber CBS 135680]|uniref:Uncharacterized protein n=1 Tax=Aspergillus ruber (strain CBS 135680) TaxID=1388766 RepID=A0A017S2P6_ASPRC|nr:uncharacterized protein EURHEDRAFT_246545 [Aspergillus ruber CBS 135680]EYE91313.1 hypothetical protein EURHEDRAFT_246545 [Aspergillus ruber CBS 135680]